MPGNSRRRRGRDSVQGRKGKSRSSYAAVPARQLAREPVVSPSASVPSPGLPTPIAKPATIRYPYIATELWTIGILAGIMLIVLVVLALVLS